MNYIKVVWNQSNKDYPVLIYSELEDDQYESRKIEKYIDGSYGYAFNNHEINDSGLSKCAVPSIEKIAEDSEFEPFEITKEEFEEVWHKAILCNA